MAVGLLGLVGLQGYYITSAWRLQRDQFDYKVTDALQEVVRTLERREISDLSRQRIRAQQQQQRLMAISRKSDSKPAFVKRNRPVSPPKQEDLIAKRIRERRSGGNGLEMPSTVVIQSDVLHSQTQPITPEQALVVATFFEQQEMLAAAGEWQAQAEQQRQFEEWANRELVGQMNQFNDDISRAYQQADSVRKRQFADNRNKQKKARASQKATRANVVAKIDSQSIGKRADEQTQMVKGVLKELLLSERPIAERLDRLTLDTLLRESLAERSISLPFAYGVRSDRTSSGKPQFLFATYNTDVNRMLQMGYRAVLFPNNLLDTGNHLYVYFPTRKEFIWSQMGFTLAASALLILTILSCFYIAISTIIRQKKMADIKNDFINNMTHEFKTPISTISLAVEMAEGTGYGVVGKERGDTEEAGRMARYLGIIRDETRRLGSHVEKVLQMALLDRGAIKLTLVPVNLHDVVEKVLNTIGLQIEQREGELVLDFEADNEIVQADEVHLTNIVYNLVDNAIKYSPDKPHITIRTQSLSDGVSLTVTDRGLGLSKEQQGRIFETFYRVPTGNLHDVKGFGLGLSYVRKMIDAHHGRITVVSELRQGSAFEVVLPYAQ